MMGAAITLSVAGGSYAAFNTGAVTRSAESVAHAADCRAVDTAIAAYLADHDAVPATVAQLRPYVRGDISAYRIVDGLAAGPGCPEPGPVSPRTSR
jgi:hypothetical protein